MPPVIWPRSAILQRAAASIVEGIFVVTVSTAEESLPAAGAEPEFGAKVNGVLNDVAFALEVRENVDRGIRDEQRSLMARHIHDEHVADPPLGPEAEVPEVTLRISSSV